MKTRLKRDARLLVLFALLAALPLAIWACGDAGDDVNGPTGPETKYNPDTDYSGATITAKVNRSVVGPGETFGILATFRDANGALVEGAPLTVWAENGRTGYFTYQTNPTLTDRAGTASIRVNVSGGCPEDSYTFVIATRDSRSARGYAYVKVSGQGGTPIVTGLTLTTSTPTVTAGNAATFVATATATPSCTVRFQYQAAGGGLNIAWTNAPAAATNPWLFPLTPTSAGTLTVLVGAYCNETGRGLVSTPVNVTVNAAN